MTLTTFDHAIIAAPDLEAAAKLWRSFGFTLTPRGEHGGGATANNCLMFPDTYLELLAAIGSGTSPLAEEAKTKGAGGLGFALGSDDPDATAQALRDAGLATQGPIDLTRPLVLDGETHQVAFRNVLFEPVLPGVLAFVCHHATPHLTRARHEWQLHANGATGLAEIVIGADAPEAYRSPLQQLFGMDHVADAPHGLSVILGNAAIAVMNPVGLAARFGTKALDGLPDLPRLAALSIAVNEPDAAGAMLDMADIPYAEHHHGLVIAAKHAGGVIVEFVED